MISRWEVSTGRGAVVWADEPLVFELDKGHLKIKDMNGDYCHLGQRLTKELVGWLNSQLEEGR